jgi:hypothetical protein
MLKLIITIVLTPLIVLASLVLFPIWHILPCNFAPAEAFEAARRTILVQNILPMVVAWLVCGALTLRVSRWFRAPCVFAALSAWDSHVGYGEQTPCINSLTDVIDDGPGWRQLLVATILSLATGWVVERLGNVVLAKRAGKLS